MNVRKRVSGFTIDWLTAVLVSLVIAFQGGAILAAPYVRGFASVPETQSTNPGIGVGLIAVIIVETLFIIGLWRVWKRLSEFTQKVLKYSIFTTLAVGTIYLCYMVGQLQNLLRVLSVAFGFIALDKLFEQFNLDWVTFDAFALTMGIGVTAMAGNAVAPIVVIPLLLLSILWDHFAVNLSDIMGELIEFSSSAGIPNYLIIPLRLHVDYDAVTEYVEGADEGEKPPGVAGVIGIGDFALPGMLAVSAWVAGADVPAVATLFGTVIAMIVLRDSMEQAEGGLPALPWLNTGALIGFGIGALVAGVSLTTALGI